MGTPLSDISRWFDQGLAKGKAYLIIACDTFDYEEYPVYTPSDLVEFWEIYNRCNNDINYVEVLEVYNLSLAKAPQIQANRAMNTPPAAPVPTPPLPLS